MSITVKLAYEIDGSDIEDLVREAVEQGNIDLAYKTPDVEVYT